jgi:hypothetical protein
MPRHMKPEDAALPYSLNTASRGDAADGHPLLFGVASSAARMEFFISLLVLQRYPDRCSAAAERGSVVVLEGEIDARAGRGGGGGTAAPPPQPSPPPAEPPADLATAARYAAPLEASLSRGLANAIGHFSGGLCAVARRAKALGRRAVWTLFDSEGGVPRRRVEATGGE